MADFVDIGEYFRRLPQSRFDQASFKINVSRLADYVCRFGISDEDLVKFFSLWLSLNIPVPKWLSIGRCMVPEAQVPGSVVDHAIKWILVNRQQDKLSRVTFVLSWLSGLVEYNLVDEESLDKYYELFFSFLDQDKYRSSVVRLVYHFTKPEDVYQWRVLHLLNIAKQPMSSKALNELYIILWRFKSLRPDLVPESLPIKSVQTAFPKLNSTLAQRFSEAQSRCRLRVAPFEKGLLWSVSTFLGAGATGAKDLPIIPDLENIALDSSASDGVETKSCLDFKSAKELLHFYLKNDIILPPSMLSLLSNEGGMLVLAFTESRNHRSLSNSLYPTLSQCFLNSDPKYSIAEKADFLERIYSLECVLLQGLPIVSQFLFEYLLTWNGYDYFKGIMDLLEWVVFQEFSELRDYVLSPLETLFISEDVYYRCSILKMLRNMYNNIHFAHSKKCNLYLSKNVKCDFAGALGGLCDFVNKLCRTSLRSFPESAMLQLSFLDFYSTITELQCSPTPTTWTIMPPIFTYSALCSPSSLMIETVISMLIKYRIIYKRVKNKMNSKELCARGPVIEANKEDFKNCLWTDSAMRMRGNGLFLKNLSDEAADKLKSELLNADTCLNIASHMAFAAKTYMHCTAKKLDQNFIDKDNWLRDSFCTNFPSIFEFVKLIDGTTDVSKLKKLIHRRLTG